MKYLSVALVALTIGACSPADDSAALGDSDAAMEEAIMSVSADAARDGPFGFEMGQPIDEVAGAEELDVPGLYRVESPPKPHSDFEVTVLEAYPNTGICMIRGVGRTILGDGAGAAIRSKVDDLASALETKYGQPAKQDICVAGSIKCRSNFWMMTLDDNERRYGYEWSNQNETMKSAGIGKIGVGAMAANIQDTWPVLEFQSADTKACEVARKASSADAL